MHKNVSSFDVCSLFCDKVVNFHVLSNALVTFVNRAFMQYDCHQKCFQVFSKEWLPFFFLLYFLQLAEAACSCMQHSHHLPGK